MLIVLLRTLFVYFMVIVAMRLMGKKQLGELQPSELVSTILISNLASISVESPETPLASSLVPLFIIVCAEILLSGACVKWHAVESMLSGNPRIVIENGVIDQDALRQLRFTVDDLMEALREKEVFKLDDIALGIVETNGKITICKSYTAAETTHTDFHLTSSKKDYPPLPIIIDGKIKEENLKNEQLSPAFLQHLFQKEHCKADEILLLICDKDHDYTLVKKRPPKGAMKKS